MSLNIYLLRHGETTASQTGGYCKSLDPELTLTGRLMADDFAKAYSDLPFAAIYSSPLERAIATAKPFIEKTGLQIQFHQGLKEMTFGLWEGKTPEEVDKEFHDDYVRWLTDPGWNAPTAGQNGVEIARNNAIALEDIQMSYPEGNVLIVSHKATIRIMLCSLFGIDIGQFRDRFHIPVGSICVVEVTKHGPLLHLIGDRSHLRKSLQNKVLD